MISRVWTVEGGVEPLLLMGFARQSDDKMLWWRESLGGLARVVPVDRIFFLAALCRGVVVVEGVYCIEEEVGGFGGEDGREGGCGEERGGGKAEDR